MSSSLILASHALCPYVQRVAIVLAEKGMPFERRDIDLASKPEWFLRASPLGKTPLLLVDDEPIFESAVICEYIDEVSLPTLHPVDALQRARHRAWVEFSSNLLNLIAAFYNAKDDEALSARAADIHGRFQQLEAVLGGGPYFAGTRFSLVDAAFGPVFRYFDVFDSIGNFGFLDGLQKVQQWRHQLSVRASVTDAVPADYPERLTTFLMRRGSALSKRLEANSVRSHRTVETATHPGSPPQVC